ncbi:MAG TPA: FGGY-family carbohydrate kinase [Acidimicrobiales bacterium]|nr:FGGY-family carbohydrate kinase [Acidimicrobiales bacterium]
MARSRSLVAGVDVATADVRVAVADGSGEILARASAPLAPPHRPDPGVSEQDARSWWPAVADGLRRALSDVDGDVVAVAVSATSGTVVLADAPGEPLAPALLYDDRRVPAPQRWDWLLAHCDAPEAAAHAWHASDFVVRRLTGTPPPTDWSHALKTGYDPGDRRWGPAGDAAALRPEVAAPTSEGGTVGDQAAAETGLPAGCSVRLGMTDGCAAQVAAGADRPGRFVTVLGTTLVVKGAGDRRIDDPPSGVYSHRHPDGWWLPGGASNTGGGSLTSRFEGERLDELDREAERHGPAKTVCYPLAGTGERFPFVAEDAEEVWTGAPADRAEAYRAVLEGVAFLERLGYERLGALGAPLHAPLRSAGAGSRSRLWTAVRATVLNVPVVTTASADTAFGACVLAAAGTVHPTLGAATDAMVSTGGPEVEPVEAERDRLDESYARFVDVLAERGWLPWRG